MHTNRFSSLRSATLRLTLVGSILLVLACQIAVPQASPAPRLLTEQTADQGSQTASVEVAGASASKTSSTPAVTSPIKRTTLRSTLTFSGKVVPALSTQLVFRGSGTVTSVHVSSGQVVKQGDVLAEFVLDDESLRAARNQATLAELAYQSEQAKLAGLQAGVSKDSVDQLRATVQRDQAEIQKLEQDRAAAQAVVDSAGPAHDLAQAAADRKISLAQVALQSAEDTLTAAQAAAARVREEANAAQQRSVAEQQQAQTEATFAASAATAAVRPAERQVEEATIKLSQAKLDWAGTSVGQQLESQQFRIDADNENLKDARAAELAARDQSPSSDHTSKQINAEFAAATAGVRAAERALAADSLELQHTQTNFANAKSKDSAEVRIATLALDAAKDQLSAAQAAEQRAQEKVATLSKAATTRTPAGPVQSDVADASVRQAEHVVETAKINLEEAQATAPGAADANGAQRTFADKSLDAARSQLSADQARLTALQAGTPALEISSQQIRTNLLRDAATVAAAAAQPITVLTAPFDGTVTQVGVNPGQTIGPGGTAVDGGATAAGALAGQTSDGRTVAIRLVAAGSNSIVADASESDVAQLSPGQSVDLSFPGLAGQKASGTIAEIADTAAAAKDNSVSYPVRIDIASALPMLKSGMTAQVNINMGDATDVLVAPRGAIRSVSGQSLVSRVGPDGQVQDVTVQVGRTLGTDVELVGGLKEGDIVAVYQQT